MSPEEFVAFVRKTIQQHLLAARGAVMFSPHRTLQPGRIYLLGTNPGKSDMTVNQHLDFWIGNPNRHVYIDGNPGKLQQQLQSLFPLLNANLRETCTSNLVFLSTPRAAGVSDAQVQVACWRVHQQIIRIVQPRLLLVFGISDPSPYDFIKKNCLSPSGERLGTESREPIGHGDYCAEAMTAQIEGRPRLVIGLPHPGIFILKRMPEVAEWINRQESRLAATLRPLIEIE